MAEASHPLVAYGRARRNGTLNIRDAAHEAFHALFVGETKNWDREHVHRKLLRKFGRRRAQFWLHELRARAVEQIVSKHFGYDAGDIEKWVGWSAMEAIRNRLPYDPDHKRCVQIATAFLEEAETKEWARRIIALVEPRATDDAFQAREAAR